MEIESDSPANFCKSEDSQKKPIKDAIKKLKEVYKNTLSGLSFNHRYIKGHRQKNKAHGGNGIVLVPTKIPVSIERVSGVKGFLSKLISSQY